MIVVLACGREGIIQLEQVFYVELVIFAYCLYNTIHINLFVNCKHSILTLYQSIDKWLDTVENTLR